MSFGVAVLLPVKKIPRNDYLAFVGDCSSILGNWHIHELSPLNPNAGEIVHDWVLGDPPDKYAASGKDVRVWVSLARDNFVKKYGRSRREIFWMINIETKEGRNIWSLAIQLLIPLKAFDHFPDIVVIVDPEKMFLEPKGYESFVMGELVSCYGKEEVEKIGIVMPGSAALNSSVFRLKP